ncbi:hypothetical protein [Paenibacillus kribbensis]|uniref:hypothetical protein n=1 Tax=Paenibacillus kribbensis TaxID=172713 RepID=UPI00083819C4|nr:hypothetical protein [Paenibacillus kribbensis]
MTDSNKSDWDKPYREIQDFEGFIHTITNWGNLYDTWEQYNIYGMISILSACLENIGKNFLEDEINDLHEHLKESHIEILIKIADSLKKYKEEGRPIDQQINDVQ